MFSYRGQFSSPTNLFHQGYLLSHKEDQDLERVCLQVLYGNLQKDFKELMTIKANALQFFFFFKKKTHRLHTKLTCPIEFCC